MHTVLYLIRYPTAYTQNYIVLYRYTILHHTALALDTLLHQTTLYSIVADTVYTLMHHTALYCIGTLLHHTALSCAMEHGKGPNFTIEYLGKL
jgi:hypothetical protein